MTFTLVLAVIVGLEAIYEYHTHNDLFLTLLGHLGPFKLSAADTTTTALIDSLGRYELMGPTDYGAELVGILTMALSIALLRFLKAKSAAAADYVRHPHRPPAVRDARHRAEDVAARAGHRLPDDRVRSVDAGFCALAPLLLVLGVGAIAVSPNTLGHIVSQFTSANASKSQTTDARTANFDAVRPDLWSHLLFGRGQGSYAPPTDRVVDSDIILPLVETGVLGMAAFLLIPLSLFSVARKKAADSSDPYSTAALVGVAAGATLLCLACLYSFMSLPHGPDVFMYMAGLTVVAVGSDGEPRGAPHARHHRLARDDRRRVRRPAPVLEAPAQQLR